MSRVRNAIGEKRPSCHFCIQQTFGSNLIAMKALEEDVSRHGADEYARIFATSKNSDRNEYRRSVVPAIIAGPRCTRGAQLSAALLIIEHRNVVEDYRSTTFS